MRKDINKAMLCYIHIPKTAGTSFTKLISGLYKENDFKIITPEYFENNSDEAKKIDFKSYNGIAGHFPYEIYKLINRPCILLSILRNPANRIYSHYREYQRVDLSHPLVRNSPNLPFLQRVKLMTFNEFVDDQHYQRQVTNLQTRMLGLEIKRDINYLYDLRPLIDAPDRIVSLELAKERLEQLTFLGIQEKYNESIELFCNIFHLPEITELERLNKSSQIEEISQLTMEKLVDYNKQDYELYEYGEKLFSKQYKALNKPSLINLFKFAGRTNKS